MIRNVLVMGMIVVMLSWLTLSPQTARAFEIQEVGVGYGHATDVSQWVQLNVISSFDDSWNFLESLELYPYLDVGLAATRWLSSGDRAYNISLTGILRSRKFRSPIGGVFVEVGTGPHLISKPGKTSRLGTAFEFNSHLGLGLKFADHWTVVLRAHHVSNGGISSNNAGVNAYVWQLYYH